MKTLPILVLLCCMVQLYNAVPALQRVTCDNVCTAAARMAVHHINDNHQHGYKVKFTDEGQQIYKVEKTFEGCNMELQFEVVESVCTTVDSKHFEECDERDENSGTVRSNCTVLMTVANGVAKVNKYDCDARRAQLCLDCPVMLSLTNTEGLAEALQKINSDPSNPSNNQYILKEVGRMRSGYVMTRGMFSYGEFVLVESNCKKGTTENCTPLCPQARHAVCHTTYSKGRLVRPAECVYFPPSNTAGPGNSCPSPMFHCASTDAAIHPICPWVEPYQQ